MLLAKARLVRRDKAPSSTTPLPDLKPSTDHAVCSTCQAVWHHGKWFLDPAIRREVQRWRTPTPAICPACRSVKQGLPAGILYLTGSFLEKNRAEILNLVRNAERAAATKNPLERVLRIEEDSRGQLVIETTSEKLARRLGRDVSKACGGTLQIRFSHEDKLVRLYWRRDTPGRMA